MLCFQFFQKLLEELNVLHAGCCLETAVEVYACQLRMMKLFDGACTACVDPPTQKEWCVSAIVPKQIPVELLSCTTQLQCLVFEKEVVADTVICFRDSYIARSSQVKGFDNL